MANLVPGQYRKVSVASVDVPLTVEALTAHFLGREVYRHTRFVVVRQHGQGDATAVVGVDHPEDGSLFTPVKAVEVLALPAECAYVVAPEVDTGIPSSLAAVARSDAPGARCVVVEGRYRHVSFILDPRPIRIRVGDVVPPAPPKLLDQARRVLELAEDLPPIELVPDVIDLVELARSRPSTRYLLPCQGSGFEVDGADVDFLDQHPVRREWTLLGCARSRAIHEWFYGDVPPTVDTCPRRLFVGTTGGILLTKCCLLDDRIADEPGVAVVPWGASLDLVRRALAGLAAAADPGMGARLTDSELYAHLWGTDELRAVFDERGRLQGWLDVLAALARAQAKLGLVPVEAADAITESAVVDRLDLAFVAEETRRTSHSTLGLIRGLQRVLPDDAAAHVYVGTTVQDVTDTWTVLALRDVGRAAWRDLRTIEGLLLDLAERHRDTVMVGRTHGQPGAPITFGYKAASWADEVRRHLDRLREGRGRWLAGQLGGAVGVLGFFGADGPALRSAFCAELGLDDPGISWLTARDRLAEFAHLLAMVTGTLARIGNEVLELQRPEIGELREPTTADVVGSITMPHKRNPERSEHLDTLARLVRAQVGVLLEGMVQLHERDGRAWKAEWVAFPEVCLLTGAALRTAVELLSGLEVDAEAMAARLHDEGSAAASEQVLAVLTARLGRVAAQEALHRALAPGAGAGLARSLAEAVVGAGLLTADEVAAVVATPAVEGAVAMVDEVVARGRAARAVEGPTWA